MNHVTQGGGATYAEKGSWAHHCYDVVRGYSDNQHCLRFFLPSELFLVQCVSKQQHWINWIDHLCKLLFDHLWSFVCSLFLKSFPCGACFFGPV